MPSQGIKKGTKRSAAKYVQLFLLIAAIAVVTLIFVRNNVDFFVKSREPSATDEAIAEEAVSVAPEKVSEEIAAGRESDEKIVAASEPERVAAIAKIESPIKPFVVEILNTDCRLADRDDFAIRLSLKIVISTKKLQQEVLLKRENLRVAIRKVMAPKKLSEVVVDKLREELKTEMNALLDAGAIDDIEFIEFSPIL